MAPAAFVATLIFQSGNRSWGVPATVSDVNAAFYLFPDGQNIYTLPGNQPVFLKDIILSAAGTDTRTATISANQKITGEVVQNSANLAANLARQFMQAPIGFNPGATLRFTQVT
jgi:hypothetical protein